jgi:hypothetical protein
MAERNWPCLHASRRRCSRQRSSPPAGPARHWPRHPNDRPNPPPPDKSPAAGPEAESAWKFSVGVIGGDRASWLSSDNYSLGYAPHYGAAWRDRLFVKNESVGVNLVKTKSLVAGLDARRGRGRSDNATDLRGVEGVDDSLELGGFLRSDPGSLRLHMEYRQDVGIGHGGSLGVFAASTKVSLPGVLSMCAGRGDPGERGRHGRLLPGRL